MDMGILDHSNVEQAMVDTEKMKALVAKLRGWNWLNDPVPQEAADAIDLLLAEVEAAAADKREMGEMLKRIPQTPEQMIGFIGSQYSSMEADGWEADLSTPSGDLSNVRYVLTVHDLLSAFSWHGLDDAASLAQRQGEGS